MARNKLAVGLLALLLIIGAALVLNTNRSSAAAIAEQRALAAMSDSDATVAYQAAMRLGEQGATATLLRAMESSDPLVRMRAAAALGRTGDQRAVPALAAALASGGTEAGEAAKALTIIGGAAAEEALLRALADETHRSSRAAAMQALAAQGEGALALLNRAELSGIPTLQGAAAELKARLDS